LRNSPAAERCIPDFDNDICWVDYLRYWAVFESDVQLAVEDHCFHCIFRHDDCLIPQTGLNVCSCSPHSFSEVTIQCTRPQIALPVHREEEAVLLDLPPSCPLRISRSNEHDRMPLRGTNIPRENRMRGSSEDFSWVIERAGIRNVGPGNRFSNRVRHRSNKRDDWPFKSPSKMLKSDFKYAYH
jgi:hypothetical protein